MHRNKRARLSVLCFAAGWIALGVASGAAAQESPDPSGTWKWHRTFNDRTIETSLKLSVKDGTLTGVLNALGDEWIEIQGARLDGDSLAFTYTRDLNGRRITVSYKGRLKGDELGGSMVLTIGGNSREFDWDARRVVELADVLGNWKITATAPGGQTFESSIAISSDEDKLRGVYTGQGGDASVKGLKLEKNELSFQFIRQRQGQSYTVYYKGRPRGDAMRGSVRVELGGRDFELTFVAKRSVP